MSKSARKETGRQRTRKGWAFDKPVYAGMHVKCFAFFRHRSDAESIAMRFDPAPKVVRATLTLDASPSQIHSAGEKR